MSLTKDQPIKIEPKKCAHYNGDGYGYKINGVEYLFCKACYKKLFKEMSEQEKLEKGLVKEDTITLHYVSAHKQSIKIAAKVLVFATAIILMGRGYELGDLVGYIYIALGIFWAGFGFKSIKDEKRGYSKLKVYSYKEVKGHQR